MLIRDILVGDKESPGLFTLSIYINMFLGTKLYILGEMMTGARPLLHK